MKHRQGQFFSGFRLLVFLHDLGEALKAGHSVLKLFKKLHQLFHRIQEHVDIQQKNRKFPDVDNSSEIKDAACHQHNHIQQIHHQIHAGEKTCHDPIGSGTRLLEIVIADREFFDFPLSGRICPRHPDAGNGIFHVGVDFGDLLAGPSESIVHITPHPDRKPYDKRQRRINDHRQQRIDGTKNDKRA